jgi:hypothetical protein
MEMLKRVAADVLPASIADHQQFGGRKLDLSPVDNTCKVLPESVEMWVVGAGRSAVWVSFP